MRSARFRDAFDLFARPELSPRLIPAFQSGISLLGWNCRLSQDGLRAEHERRVDHFAIKDGDSLTRSLCFLGGRNYTAGACDFAFGWSEDCVCGFNLAGMNATDAGEAKRASGGYLRDEACVVVELRISC